MECIELNGLCNHMKKVKDNKTSISVNSCTELSKTQIFPVSAFKSNRNQALP